MKAIFDCDGVIVDTEGTKFSAWQQALEQIGQPLAVEEYVSSFAGKSGKQNVAYINSSRGLSLPETFVDTKNDILKKLMEGELLLMPYAADTIRNLHARGFDMGVASSDGQEETQLKLRRIGLESMFRVYRGTDKKREPQKPDPFIYRAVAELMGANPSECIAIEDTNAGVVAAKEAGMMCVAVPNSYSSTHDFSRADLIVPNLSKAETYLCELLSR